MAEETELRKRLGCIKSEDDSRDTLFALAPIEEYKPRKFSIKDQFRDVRNQEDVPACTAFACCSALEALKGIYHYTSPRDLYCRRSNSSPGMSLRNAFSILKKEGVVTERCLPFIADESVFCSREPCSSAELQRLNHHTSSYHRVPIPSIADTLWREKKPLLVAVPVYENWERVLSDGVIPLPNGSRLIGLHAVVISGWMNINGQMHYEFRNSWGASFGARGYGYLPSTYQIIEAWLMKIGTSIDKVEVKEWTIGDKASIFGLPVTFSIQSTTSCTATLFVNHKQRMFKRIRQGASKVVFHIPFSFNSEEHIRLVFADFTHSFGTWEGSLKASVTLTERKYVSFKEEWR